MIELDIGAPSPLEHPPIRLNQPDCQAAAQPIDSGAISCRPDDTVRSESALGVTLGQNRAGQSGANVAVHAPDATAVWLCLFDSSDRETARIPLAHRTGGVWHAFVPGLGLGARYGLRADGPFAPEDGLRFNPAKLLLDPYARELDRPLALAPSQFDRRIYGEEQDRVDSALEMPKAIVRASPSLTAVKALHPLKDLVIYELNIRAFSKLNLELPEAIRGTFAGLGHPISVNYLKELGINAVELLPITAWIDERHLPPLGLTNAWGYNPVSYLAPDPRLAPGGWAEVRAAVDALHEAGIAVLIDVVYNHSGESDHLGPTLSLRGLDNPGYYRLQEKKTFYINDAGCGNILAGDHAPVRHLVLESLRHMALAGGVDGFRYDLATVLARSKDGFDRYAPLLDQITTDPVLANLIHIAEPWDIGPGGYQVGQFPATWGEWNDRYRDSVRRFWRGDLGLVGELATRLAGSADLFARAHRPLSASINFITAHDGFTLHDLVSYSKKHNESNGEHNRDGTDSNHSWNNGVEGPAQDPVILNKRGRDMRALIATLIISRGVPMFTMGDERGRTQCGNNNAYAQDNELSWLDWSTCDEAMLAFTKQLIHLRKTIPALSDDRVLSGTVRDETGLPDVIWLRPDGQKMTTDDWENPHNRTLFAAFYTQSHRVLTAIHGGDQSIAFTLPTARGGYVWRVAADSSWPERTTEVAPDTHLAPRSVVVFVEREETPPIGPRGIDDTALGFLSEAVGIQADWWDLTGHNTLVPKETKLALLRGMGLGVESTQDVRDALAMINGRGALSSIPRTVTLRQGRDNTLALGGDLATTWRPVHFLIELENGDQRQFTVAPHEGVSDKIHLSDGRLLPRRTIILPPLPLGRHRLILDDVPEQSCWLNSVPGSCYPLNLHHKAFGLSAQVYTLKTESTQGIGDYSALGQLVDFAAQSGSAAVGINPLHALLSHHREQASPYSPSDRRFIDPIMIDVRALPEILLSDIVVQAWSAREAVFTSLDQAPFIDYPAVWAAKDAVLHAAWVTFALLDPSHPLCVEFLAFVAKGGTTLHDYALFEAISDLTGTGRYGFPSELSSPEASGIGEFQAQHAARIREAMFRQFLAQRQLAQAANAAHAKLSIGLYADLAVGCAPDGAEAWAEQSRFMKGASIGAPPDPFAMEGQVWNLPGLNPLASADDGFRQYGDLMAANMANMGMIRIDHVLGLKRIFLVPDGATGREGAYLSMPFEHLAGQVAQESHRAKCVVVGEDLGTVPLGFRDELADWAMNAMKVFWFEREWGGFTAPKTYAAKSVACVSSHDLPPLAGWWQGEDISEDLRLGRLSAEAEPHARAQRASDKAALVAAISASGVPVPDEHDPSTLSADMIGAIHGMLATAGSEVALAQVDDLSGETIAVNLPGTNHERPNWRRRLSIPLEELRTSPQTSAILSALQQRAFYK